MKAKTISIKIFPCCSCLHRMGLLKCKHRHHIYSWKSKKKREIGTDIGIDIAKVACKENIRIQLMCSDEHKYILLCWYCARNIQFTRTSMHISRVSFLWSLPVPFFGVGGSNTTGATIFDAIMRQLDLSEKALQGILWDLNSSASISSDWDWSFALI